MTDPKATAEICRAALRGAAGESAARLDHELARAVRKMGKLTDAESLEHAASDGGYPPGQARWAGILYRDGRYSEAFKLLPPLVEKSRYAMFWMGDFYLDGVDGYISKCEPKGVALIHAAAEAHEPTAMAHRCAHGQCETMLVCNLH